MFEGGVGLKCFTVLLQEVTSYRMETNLFEINDDSGKAGGEGLTLWAEGFGSDPV